ncbi:DUF4214 domain-containing protein [Massilia sp. GCM10020059]|uniref:DUF4214 domain-containing protein n=1 Tax=Massilia agrisoli TaxID=2892444 RepID=A0ABS8IY86_9BURK|nr:DUF4214 domain-containing protein [Massilia agrisoli]MCC6073470.1 DUF4214 domain-containing protein [Massilia agrisoli]
MATTYHTEIQKLYVAYFNRPADPGGLAFWEGVVEAANGSTTAVAAAFAASAEYQAEYAGMSTADIINQIYINLFGRSAEPTGLAFWANAVANGAVTIDTAVTTIAAGAQGTDKVAFDSKVTYASAFTAALDTPAEQAGYAGEFANDAAKAIVAGIKTAAQLTAALVPATLAASVAAVIDASVPFTLAGGLAALDAANTARAEFLEEIELDAAGVATAVTDAELALDVLIDDADTVADEVYVDATPAIAAAMLSDEIEERAEVLAGAQEDYDAAVTAAAAVKGLTTAIANMTAAETNLEAMVEAQVEAEANLAAALASYEVKTSTDVTITADGEVAGVIVLDEDGVLVLADDITETTNPGVTALLAAIVAKQSADLEVAGAEQAVFETTLIVDVIDLTAGAGTTALAAVGAAMTVVVPVSAAKPTGVEIITEINALTAIAEAKRALSDATPADVALDAEADTAEANLAGFLTKVSDFQAADADLKAQAVVDTADLVADAADAVEALDEAIADLAEATAVAAQLKALDDAIVDAKAEFTEAKLQLPVDLTAFVAATAGSDIYLAGDVATSTVVGFGDLGTDSLFIGSQYTLNTTGDLTKGNNAVLEAFMVQSGTSVKVYLETEVYGSDTAAVAEQVITLTGITVAELTLANGIITAA